LALPNITDDLIGQFWNWSVSITNNPVSGHCWSGTSADGTVLFLMDPVDASPGGAIATLQQSCPGKLVNIQGILIPLWVAWADTNEHPTLSGGNLGLCAKGEYNVGNVVAQVTVNNVVVASVTATLTRTAGNPNDDPPQPVTVNITQTNVTQYTTAGNFILHIPTGSIKPGVTPGTDPHSASDGFWVMLDPAQVNGPVSYRVTVTPPPLGLREVDFPNGFGIVTITYTF